MSTFNTDHVLLIVDFLRGRSTATRLDLWNATISLIRWLGGVALAGSDDVMSAPADLAWRHDAPHILEDACGARPGLSHPGELATVLEHLCECSMDPAQAPSNRWQWLLPILAELLSRLASGR